MNTVIDVLTIVLLFAPVAGFIASAFLWRVYLSDEARPRSWVLLLFALGATIVSFAGLSISAIAVIRLTGSPIGTTGGLILAIVLLILEGVPIWYAATVWYRRRLARVEAESSSSSEPS